MRKLFIFSIFIVYGLQSQAQFFSNDVKSREDSELFYSLSSPEFMGTIACGNSEQVFKCVKYLKNYDGDTITFNIPNVHELLGDAISVRLLGVDTPEMRTHDACEREMALRAKEEVHKVLVKAETIVLRDVIRGKYFRIVAKVMVNRRDLSKRLLKKGLAVPYDGKTKPIVNWCEYLQP